jgi:hypothetical protein
MQASIKSNLIGASALLLTLGTNQAEDLAGPWSSTSDWFHPAPAVSVEMFIADKYVTAGNSNVIEIPVELIRTVPPKFRHRAAILLGVSDVTPLSDGECRTLSCGVNTDRLFNKTIANTRQKLDSILGHGLVYNGIPTEYSEETVAKIVKEQSVQIADLRKEIVTLQKWRHSVHPFLVKAVALSESSGGFFGFSARIFRDALIIHHESSGSQAAPMKNVPVVVFLERKPTKVYHTVAMLPGPPAKLDNRTEATVEPWKHK